MINTIILINIIIIIIYKYWKSHLSLDLIICAAFRVCLCVYVEQASLSVSYFFCVGVIRSLIDFMMFFLQHEMQLKCHKSSRLNRFLTVPIYKSYTVHVRHFIVINFPNQMMKIKLKLNSVYIWIFFFFLRRRENE